MLVLLNVVLPQFCINLVCSPVKSEQVLVLKGHKNRRVYELARENKKTLYRHG